MQFNISTKQLSLFFICSILTIGSYIGVYRYGINAGLDKYHDACYNVGGLVIRDNKVVGCVPMGKLDEQPLENKKPQGLDKDRTV